MRSPFLRSLAIAVALHVATVAALATQRPAHPSPPEAPPPTPLLVFLEQLPAAPATAHREEEPRAPSGPGREGTTEPRRAQTGSIVPEATSSAPAAAPLAPTGPSTNPEPTDDRDARARTAMAGLFGGKLAPGPMAPAPPESSVAPPAPSISKDRAGEVVRDLLDARDREIGVGFGGPVATAAHQAALGGKAPQTGNAVLEALTDPSGTVTSVRVISGSPSADAWSSVASATLAALRSRPLRVGGRSASVVVRLDAKMQLPSGATGSGIKPKGAGAEFDLSDVGAKELRVVAVRVVSERRL